MYIVFTSYGMTFRMTANSFTDALFKAEELYGAIYNVINASHVMTN